MLNFEDIAGSSHGDTLTGDAGDNWIYAGNGNDTIDGGWTPAYGDTYDAAAAEDGVTVDLGAGTSTGGSGTDTLTRHREREGSDVRRHPQGQLRQQPASTVMTATTRCPVVLATGMVS